MAPFTHSNSNIWQDDSLVLRNDLAALTMDEIDRHLLAKTSKISL